MKSDSRRVPPTLMLFLAGLTALGFLVTVWQHRQMPALLRAILIIMAASIVAVVGWALTAGWRH